MTKIRAYTKKSNILTDKDYEAIKTLESHNLTIEQIHKIIGWSMSAVRQVLKSKDYPEYRQRNAERLKLTAEANVQPEPVNATASINSESLRQIAVALQELVVVAKHNSKRRIL